MVSFFLFCYSNSFAMANLFCYMFTSWIILVALLSASYRERGNKIVTCRVNVVPYKYNKRSHNAAWIGTKVAGVKVRNANGRAVNMF